MENRQIPLSKPYFDNEEISNIKQVLESGWVTQGPAVKQFEENFASYIGAKYTVAVNNCTAALHLAMIGAGIKDGDEVLVADFTFPATGHSVVYCRGKPVFVDIDPKTYNMDPGQIEALITEKTKAVVPVHTFGQPADMDPIIKISKKYGLKVIEDAACAHGALYKGKFAGAIGDIGCFSFHARKGMTTGEGGMIATNDKALADKMRYFSVFGMQTAWEREVSDEFMIPRFNDIGFNYKMSDINAAVGLSQLKKLETIIKRKRELASYFNDRLGDVDLIEPPYEDKDVRHVYQSYVALVDRSINRNKLIKKLRDIGVQAQIGTYASHVQPVYKSQCSCPVSLDIFNRSIALPFYYVMDKKDIDKIVSELKIAMGESKWN